MKFRLITRSAGLFFDLAGCQIAGHFQYLTQTGFSPPSACEKRPWMESPRWRRAVALGLGFESFLFRSHMYCSFFDTHRSPAVCGYIEMYLEKYSVRLSLPRRRRLHCFYWSFTTWQRIISTTGNVSSAPAERIISTRPQITSQSRPSPLTDDQHQRLSAWSG